MEALEETEIREHLRLVELALGRNTETGNLGPVANPYRLVKYLALRTERYGADTLSDLRLHSLGLLAGLSTTVEEPTGQDGTCSSASNSNVVEVEQEFTLNFLDLMTATWELVNWWPRLFLRFDQTLGSIFSIVISYDLIGNMEMHQFSVVSEVEQQYSEPEIDDAFQQIDFSLEHLFWLGVSLFLEAALITTMRSLRVATWGMVWYGLAVLGWFAAFVIWITILNDLVEMGTSHAIEIVVMLLSFMFFLFPDSFSQMVSGWNIIGDERLLSLCSGMLGDMDQMLGFRNWLLGIIEYLVILICAYYVGLWLTVCLLIVIQGMS